MSATTPRTAPAKQLMTANEFWEFVHRPENLDRDFELLRGEVIEMSRPTTPHGVVASLVAFELQLYARQVRSGYVTTNDSGVALGRDDEPDSVLGPDIAYFREVNKFDDLHPKWSDVPPVLAVEISSPNDRPGRINKNIQEYLRCGVQVVWQVDYEERNVTIYRTGTGFEVIPLEGTIAGGNELPGLAIPVANIFQLPGDRTNEPT